MAVICPKCQHENPDDTLFCGKCGASLESADGSDITKTFVTTKPATKGKYPREEDIRFLRSWEEAEWKWFTRPKTPSLKG